MLRLSPTLTFVRSFGWAHLIRPARSLAVLLVSLGQERSCPEARAESTGKDGEHFQDVSEKVFVGGRKVDD